MALKRSRKASGGRKICFNCRTSTSKAKCRYTVYSMTCDHCLDNGLECDLQEVQDEYIEQSDINSCKDDKPVLRRTTRQQQPQPTFSDLTSAGQGLQAGTHQAKIGVDLGTKNTSISYNVVPEDAKVLFGEQIDLTHVRDGNTHRIPTELAILQERGGLRLIFGAQVARELRMGNIVEEDVFRLIKMALIPNNEISFREDAEMIRNVKRAHERTLKKFRGQTVTIKSDYDNTRISRKIKSMKDVIREYIRFLTGKIKLDIADTQGLSKTTLDTIFSDPKRTTTAIGTPAAWTNDMLDELHDIALEAGLPNATLVAEARCALIEVAQQWQNSLRGLHDEKNRSEIMQQLAKTVYLIVDIGGGTTDLIACTITSIIPHLAVEAKVKGRGSMWGANRLNELFRIFASQNLSTILDEVAGGIQSDPEDDGTRLSREELIDILVPSFEEATWSFNGCEENDVAIRLSSGDTIPLNIRKLHGERLGVRDVYLSVAEMLAIFDEFLVHMYQLIDDQVADLEGKGLLTENILKMVLVGGGTTLPYVNKKIRQTYGKDFAGKYEVLGRDNNGYSMVSKGAFFTAMDAKLGHTEHARCAYGTELVVKYEKEIHGADCPLLEHDPITPHAQEVAGCALWAIKPAGPLSGGLVHGWIHIDNEDFTEPLELANQLVLTYDPVVGNMQHLKISDHPEIVRGPELIMEVAKQQHRFKPHELKSEDGDIIRKYLEIEYYALPQVRGEQVFWLFKVHKDGQFPRGFDIYETSEDILEMEHKLQGVRRHAEAEMSPTSGSGKRN